MLEKEIAGQLTHLIEVMNNSDAKEGSVLRIFHELYLLAREGRDLPPETVDWLNETAIPFLCPQLQKVLSDLRLEAYGFKFAALHLIDIEDVIDDLSNGEILKNIHSFPPGAFSKLKRELLGSWEMTKKLVSEPPSVHAVSQDDMVLFSAESAPSTRTIESLDEMFMRSKEDSWECQGCFLRNFTDINVCLSCESIKPGTVAPTKPAEKVAILEVKEE